MWWCFCVCLSVFVGVSLAVSRGGLKRDAGRGCLERVYLFKGFGVDETQCIGDRKLSRHTHKDPVLDFIMFDMSLVVCVCACFRCFPQARLSLSLHP